MPLPKLLPFRFVGRSLLLGTALGCAVASAQMQAPKVGGGSSMDNGPDTTGTDGPTGRHRLSNLTVLPEDFSTLKLSPGFLLSMDVSDAPEFSSDLRIDSTGDVLVPSLGRVHVAGQTLNEASVLIAQRLESSRILNHPQITLNVAQYAGQSITVLGEVHNPGRFELLAPHNLADVIALSGGETAYAGGVIELRHPANYSPRTEYVHHSRAMDDATLVDTEIHPGDTVTVRRAGLVYVLGGVHRPGGYVMQEGGELDLSQALALAYGTTMDAAVSSMRVIRKLPDGKVQEFPVAYRAIMKGKEAPPRLQAEDVIYVPISKVKTVLGAGLLTATAQAAIYAK